MKMIRLCLLFLSLFCCSYKVDALFSDRDFNQDRMIFTNYSVVVLSPFEEDDHITAYTEYGTLLWDVTIYSKVISWKVKDGLLYIFSKSRYAEKTYLTCIDLATGYVRWERP